MAKKQIVGRKIGMTQIYREDGVCVPVTLIEAGPCTVIQVKTKETDGYNALQVAFGKTKKQGRVTRAVAGHYKKAGREPSERLQEIPWDGKDEVKPGDEINVGIFENIKKVDVCGYSKGRGFMSAIARWGFGRQPASHGASNRERSPGSLSGGVEGGKTGGVVRGKQMAGHWGVEKVTVRNLNVAHLDKNKHLLAVEGGVPGPNGALVLVKEGHWVPPKAPTVVSKKKGGKR